MNDIEIPEKTTSFNVRDEYKNKTQEELGEIVKSKALPFAVALGNVTGDLNLGMAIRSSAIFAAEKVFIFGRRKYDRRTTVGGHKYIPEVEAHHLDIDPFDWDTALQIIRVNNYTPIIIEQYGKDLPQYISDWHYGKPCLVFGPEDIGIPKSICDRELCYKIPQYGILRSLNVASAAAIAIQFIASQLHYNR